MVVGWYVEVVRIVQSAHLVVSAVGELHNQKPDLDLTTCRLCLARSLLPKALTVVLW